MAKKKIFSGEECLKASRWGEVLPAWPKEQKERIEGRIDELLKENEEWIYESETDYLGTALCPCQRCDYSH